MAERAGLLNRCTGLNLYRGFESLPLRKQKKSRRSRDFFMDMTSQARLSEGMDIKKSSSEAAKTFCSLTPPIRDHVNNPSLSITKEKTTSFLFIFFKNQRIRCIFAPC